jgi:integrase
MPIRKPHTPSYRRHKARNCAVVTIQGKDHYLGEYGSAQSREKYHRLLAETFSSAKPMPPEPDALAGSMTVNELMVRYMAHVESYYVKDGTPTSEQATIRHALCFMRRFFGSTPALQFSPKRLKTVRQAMIDHVISRTFKSRDPITGEVILDPLTNEPKIEVRIIHRGLARRFINKQIARIKRMFAWSVEEDLLPVEVHQALACVPGLKKGKSPAREKPRVKPVPPEIVEKTLVHLPETIRTMVEVQYLADMRPQEVLVMRAIDIDMSSEIWEYRPHRYKTAHHNDDDDPDQERIVFLGPKAQELLKRYLTLKMTNYLFSPKQSEEQRRKQQRDKRETPLWPSHLRHQAQKRLQSVRRQLAECYDFSAYRHAIGRACRKAGVPIWSPRQLRHSRSTEIRKKYGLEASKACAGHREIGTTQHYAEQDRNLAYEVMREIG